MATCRIGDRSGSHLIAGAGSARRLWRVGPALSHVAECAPWGVRPLRHMLRQRRSIEVRSCAQCRVLCECAISCAVRRVRPTRDRLCRAYGRGGQRGAALGK